MMLDIESDNMGPWLPGPLAQMLGPPPNQSGPSLQRPPKKEKTTSCMYENLNRRDSILVRSRCLVDVLRT